MKKYLPLYIVIIFTQIFYSQGTKTLQGKVLFKENAVRDVEVINWNKKSITKTDANGIFYIDTSENDTLYFLSKSHLDKKSVIKKADFKLDIFKIYLTEKTIDLEEIEILQNKSAGIKFDQTAVEYTASMREANRLENREVRMGKIENGMDFGLIFKKIANLFKSKNDDLPAAQSDVSFKKFIQSNLETDYFIKTLRLRPDDISKFIAFCNQDPEAQKVVKQSNVLSMMDFLDKKNREFIIINK